MFLTFTPPSNKILTWLTTTITLASNHRHICYLDNIFRSFVKLFTRWIVVTLKLLEYQKYLNTNINKKLGLKRLRREWMEGRGGGGRRRRALFRDIYRYFVCRYLQNVRYVNTGVRNEMNEFEIHTFKLSVIGREFGLTSGSTSFFTIPTCDIFFFFFEFESWCCLPRCLGDADGNPNGLS